MRVVEYFQLSESCYELHVDLHDVVDDTIMLLKME